MTGDRTRLCLFVLAAKPHCAANFKVSSNNCVPCAVGAARAGGDDPSGADTNCLCAVDHKVTDHRCVPCAAGRINRAQDDPTGPDTKCVAQNNGDRPCVSTGRVAYASAVTGVRYAFRDNPCCPGIERDAGPPPPREHLNLG